MRDYTRIRATYKYKCAAGHVTRKTYEIGVLAEATKDCGSQQTGILGVRCSLLASVQPNPKIGPPKLK